MDKCYLYILSGFLHMTFVTGNDVTNTSQLYQPCGGISYRFDGYTYTIDPVTNEKLWSHCSFPSPISDHTLCGRPKINGKHFLCDPDLLLSSGNKANNIDEHLQTLQKGTSTLCVNTNGEHESFIVGVALINRIRIPDLQSPILCTNECGRLQPVLDISTRYPSDLEQEEIMKNFADNLRTTWSLGTCDNDVIILYCKEFNKVYVSPGRKASNYLTPRKINELRDIFSTYINQGGFQDGLEQGLLHMIASLRSTLRGFTTGHLIMVVHICTLIVTGTGFYLYLFVRNDHLAVWGRKLPWKISDGLLQAVTGLWIIKGVLLGIAWISDSKGNGMFYALVAAFGGLFLCIAIYVASLYL